MEENRNEMVEFETTESNWEYTDIPATSGEGLGPVGKIAIGLGIAAVSGAVGFLVANKDKIKEKRTKKQIEKLRKQGYAVELENVEAEIVDEDKVEIEPEEN